MQINTNSLRKDACTRQSIGSLSKKIIAKTCSHVAVNKRALGIAERFEPIETSAIYTPPKIRRRLVGFVNYQPAGTIGNPNNADNHSRISIDELNEILDARIAEIEAENAASSGESYSLQGNGLAHHIEVPQSAKQGARGTKNEASARNILVFAPAGAGKSILLDRLAIYFAKCDDSDFSGPTLPQGSSKEFESWLDRSIEGIRALSGKTPLLLRCRDLPFDFTENDDLESQIVSAIFQRPASELTHISNQIRDADASRFVVLVDGLDELPKSITPAHLHRTLVRMFSQDIPAANNTPSVIMTSRETAIDDEARDFLKENRFEAFEVVPLNRMNQGDRGDFIYGLARAWYACQRLSAPEADQKARLLRSTIERDWDIRFRNFLRSPLELTLCLVLFSNVDNFPTTEHGLYSKYINARLSWRRSSATPTDLVLLLSFCAAKTAELSKEAGSFMASVKKATFTKWLEVAYSILGARLENIHERGFDSPADAASHDLEELINVHGVLSHHGDSVSFEHRQLQVFLAENGLATGACPRSFSLQTYAETYTIKKESGILSEDWAALFAFFVQDSRIGDQALQEMWTAVSTNADLLEYTDAESNIFLAILMDGRIADAAQSEHLEKLLQVFCCRHIKSSQLDAYRKLSTDRRYSTVVNAIEALYQNSDQYYYCFTVASFDIFAVLQGAKGPGITPEDAARILDLPESIDDHAMIRLLHRLEILFFFRTIKGGKLYFSRYFFEGGSDECNDAIRLVLERSWEMMCLTSSRDNIVEYARVLGPLSESAVCRRIICESAISTNAPLSSFITLIESLGKTKPLDEGGSAGLALETKRMLWLLSSFSTNELFDKFFLGPDSKRISSLVKQHYIESMRWMASQFVQNSSAEISKKDVSSNVVLPAFPSIRELDEGLSAFIEVFRNGRKAADEKSELRAIFEQINRLVIFRPVDPEELRIAASSILNAARFDIISDPGVLLMASRIVETIKERFNVIDKTEFGSPGRTLEILCDENRLRFEIRGKISEALNDNTAGQNELSELKFIAIDSDGKRIECETLFTFDSPETGKSYIVYTDNSIDEGGNTKVYASAYNPNQLSIDVAGDLASLELLPLESELEWDLVETILNEMQEAVEECS